MLSAEASLGRPVFRYFDNSPEVIRLVMTTGMTYRLSPRNVKDLPA
ncbi:hypothetical protein [Brevundimonas sp.]